ncbi:hypothetical protein AB0J89_24935 [Micromonospora chokoriensis]
MLVDWTDRRRNRGWLSTLARELVALGDRLAGEHQQRSNGTALDSSRSAGAETAGGPANADERPAVGDIIRAQGVCHGQT